MQLLVPHADFITFNLTAEPGASLLESRHRATLRGMLGDASSARPRTRLRPMLFAKLAHGIVDATHVVLEELMRADFDGVVLAAECRGEGTVPESEALRTLAALARRVDGQLAVVAVGGAADAWGIRARLDCGADLVQVHRAFQRGGAAWLRRVREQCAARSASEARHPETARGSMTGDTPKELSPILLSAGAGQPSGE